MERCETCPKRPQCTTAKGGRGRTLRVAKNEPFQHELRARMRTAEGRAELRERTAVEHTLARIGQLQGTKARYKGVDKNQCDLERHATLNNCYILNQLWEQVEDEAAKAA